MYYRNASILKHEDISTSGTKTLDLSLQDVVSRLNIQVKATNNGAAPTAHPAKIISKIEVVDGSDVLWGLSGQEALALQFYNTKRSPLVINNYLNDVMNIVNYEIYFGRHLYDPVLGLDLTKYRNPQLKITHSKASGGSAPDACTLEVTADVFDQKAGKPSGFLMAKENVSYSLQTSANEYIDLPTDYPMRKLLVMSLAAGKQPWELFNELKLSEDNDKKVPFDDKTSDLIKYFAAQWPQIQESIEGAALTTTRNFYMMSTYEVEMAVLAMGFASAYLKSDYMYGGRVNIRGSAACNFKSVIRGYCPFGALCIPFGDQNVVDDWFDVTKIGSLRLTAKAGSSLGSDSPTCEVITEQLRTYGATA
jgi:hypothetical protein